MGTVHSAVIETALDSKTDSRLTERLQQENTSPTVASSIHQTVCNEIRRVTAEPSQRELYRLLRTEMQGQKGTAEKSGYDTATDRPEASPDRVATPASDTSVNDPVPAASQSKAIAPKKKFLIGYRCDEEQSVDKPGSPAKQSPPTTLPSSEEIKPVADRQQEPASTVQSLATVAADNKDSGRSRSNTVSLPVRSRAPPPTVRREPISTMANCQQPSADTAGMASSARSATIQTAHKAETFANIVAAAVNDAASRTPSRRRPVDPSAMTSVHRGTVSSQEVRSGPGTVDIKAPQPVSTAYYPTIQQRQQQQQQQQQYMSRMDAKSQQQQLAAQYGDRPSNQAMSPRGYPAQMDKQSMESRQQAYYMSPSGGQPQPYNSPVEQHLGRKMSAGEYDRMMGRPGMDSMGRHMQTQQQQVQNTHWPPSERYGQNAASRQMDAYRSEQLQRESGISATKYRAVDRGQGYGMGAQEMPQQQKPQQQYDRQRLVSVDPKALSGNGGYSKPRAETVRQQVHEQFETMFPPQQDPRVVQHSPLGSGPLVDQRMAAGYQPMEPIEPSVQPRIAGLMHHTASPAASSRSSRDSDAFIVDPKYQQQQNSLPSNNAEAESRRRMMRASAANEPPPLLFATTADTRATASSSVCSQSQLQSVGRQLPEQRVAPESPLDLTVRRDEPLTAEVFLRRCREQVQELDHRGGAGVYAAGQTSRNSSAARYVAGPYPPGTADSDVLRGSQSYSRYQDYRMSAERPTEPQPQPDPRRTFAREPTGDWPMSRRPPSSGDNRLSPRVSHLAADPKAAYAATDESRMTAEILDSQGRSRYVSLDDQRKMAAWAKRENVAVMDMRPMYDGREQYSRLVSTEVPGHPTISGTRAAPADLLSQPRDVRRHDQQTSASSQVSFEQKMPSDIQNFRPSLQWPQPNDRTRSQSDFIGSNDGQRYQTLDVDAQQRFGRSMEIDLTGGFDNNESTGRGRSPSLPQLSPVPPQAAAAAANRRIPIVQLLGSHSPSDILHLRCNVCASTYGSLRSFRMHFAKAHGLEPSPEHFTIQTISDARSAMSRSGMMRDSMDDSQNLEDSPPSLQRETMASMPAQNFQSIDVEHRKPGDFGAKQVAEVYPIPKKSSPLKVDVEGNQPATPVKRSPPVAVKRSDEGRNMKCLKCGHFSTQDWGVFRRHIRTHSETASGGSDTPDPVDVDVDTGCAVCLEGFSDLTDWKVHVASQHMMRSCACKSCDLGFTNASALRRHLVTAHGVETAVGGDIEVEYRCLFCPEVFSDERELYAHTHAHEHRYMAQRNLRYAPRNGQHNFQLLHRVQTAIPDTTCPEEQKPSTDLLPSSSSTTTSTTASPTETKPLLSGEMTPAVAANTYDHTALSGPTNSPPAKLFAEPQQQPQGKFGSKKASILRRLPSDGEDVLPAKPQVIARSSSAADLKTRFLSQLDEFNSEVGERPKVFGDLLRSMHHQVESSVLAFTTSDTSTTSTMSYSRGVANPSSVTFSAPQVRDIFDAIITKSIREHPVNCSLLDAIQRETSLPASSIGESPRRGRPGTSPQASPPRSTELNMTAGPIGRLRLSSDSNGSSGAEAQGSVGSPKQKSPRSSVGESVDTKDESTPSLENEPRKVMQRILSGSSTTEDAGDWEDTLITNKSSSADQTKSMDCSEMNSDRCDDDVDMFEQPLCIDLNRNMDDDNDDDKRTGDNDVSNQNTSTNDCRKSAAVSVGGQS